METVLITGGTGLIGRALTTALLNRNYNVIILSRKINDNASMRNNLAYSIWNIEEQTLDANVIASADFIIHLAGTSVAGKRWTRKRKQEIINSRVNSSRLIVDSLKNIPNKVKAVVSASAIGWYGADGLTPAFSEASTGKPNPSSGGEGWGEVFEESDPPAKDFLGNTCKEWEESIDPVTQSGKRLVKLRTGIVLSKDGGALKEFLKPLRFGIATILGNGKQVISWIHIDDLVQLYIKAIENESMNGVYNAVSPNPVSNKELTIQLAKSRKRFYIPVHIPSFILKIILGEMSVEVLKSATVSAKKIVGTGFVFNFPTIVAALG